MAITSFDRVLSALQGLKTDRPPFTLTLSLFGAGLTGCPLPEYYRNPEKYLEGQDAVVGLVDPDILFAPFALTLEAEAFGSELVFPPANPPNVKKPAFRHPEAFKDLAIPDLVQSRGLAYLRKSVRLLSEKYKGSKPVCSVLTAPVDLPALLMGIDMWVETLLFHESLAEEILEKTGRHFIALANALLSEGAAFIALPVMFTHPSLLFRKIINETILPALRRTFAEIKGPIVFHHGGNPILNDLESYLDLPQVVAFALDHRDSLEKARAIAGPGRVLLGNLNGPSLNRTPLTGILKKVDQILTDRLDDPCFIFATSAADVPLDTPPEILAAVSSRIRSWTGES